MINDRRTGMYLPLRRPLYLEPAGPVRKSRAYAPAARGEVASRSVSGRVTLAVAGLAAMIVMVLWLTAQLSAAQIAPDRAPEQLGVMQVQAGETLQAFANRVLPDVPASQAIDRIESLNNLRSPVLEAGQTLIAPVN